jgi:hypothetical protein
LTRRCRPTAAYRSPGPEPARQAAPPRAARPVDALDIEGSLHDPYAVGLLLYGEAADAFRLARHADPDSWVWAASESTGDSVPMLE